VWTILDPCWTILLSTTSNMSNHQNYFYFPSKSDHNQDQWQKIKAGLMDGVGEGKEELRVEEGDDMVKMDAHLLQLHQEDKEGQMAKKVEEDMEDPIVEGEIITKKGEMVQGEEQEGPMEAEIMEEAIIKSSQLAKEVEETATLCHRIIRHREIPIPYPKKFAFIGTKYRS
jgi:hypothetical protein